MAGKFEEGLEILKNIVKGNFGTPRPTPITKKEFYDGANWWNFATEYYADNAVFDIRPCLAASTTDLGATYVNGTAGGEGATLTSNINQVFTIDGVTPPVGARVLSKDQTIAFQNGIYILTNAGSVSTPWILTRSTDYDTFGRILQGGVIEVSTGTVNAVTSWMQTGSVAVLGTDSLTYVLLAKSGNQAVAGTPNEIDVTYDNNVAVVSITSNPTIPGNAYIQIPLGTTAQRPTTPVAGMERFNNGL